MQCFLFFSQDGNSSHNTEIIKAISMASVMEQPTQDEIQEIIQNVSMFMALTSHCTDSFLSTYQNTI
jgi:hypothetical protein